MWKWEVENERYVVTFDLFEVGLKMACYYGVAYVSIFLKLNYRLCVNKQHILISENAGKLSNLQTSSW